MNVVAEQQDMQAFLLRDHNANGAPEDECVRRARKIHGYATGIDSAKPTDGGTTKNGEEEAYHSHDAHKILEVQVNHDKRNDK